MRGFDGHIRRLYPGRKIAALPWRSDDGFDSIELRMGHLMRRGGQAWPMLMGLSFRGLCECYAAFVAYVRAEQKAGGGMD